MDVCVPSDVFLAESVEVFVSEDFVDVSPATLPVLAESEVALLFVEDFEDVIA